MPRAPIMIFGVTCLIKFSRIHYHNQREKRDLVHIAYEFRDGERVGRGKVGEETREGERGMEK